MDIVTRLRHVRAPVFANEHLCGEAAAEIERLQAALREIADSKFCNYQCTSADSYGIGVTDGHRFCAKVARAALAGTDPAIPSRQGDGGADVYCCPRCGGQGDIPVGNKGEVCPMCDGKGEVDSDTAADNYQPTEP